MAMKKSDLLNPKQMVQTKGGYAELQPVESAPVAPEPAGAKTPRTGRGPSRRSASRTKTLAYRSGGD